MRARRAREAESIDHLGQSLGILKHPHRSFKECVLKCTLATLAKYKDDPIVWERSFLDLQFRLDEPMAMLASV